MNNFLNENKLPIAIILGSIIIGLGIYFSTTQKHNAKHKEMVKICESLPGIEKCFRRDGKEKCMTKCLYNLYKGNTVR